MTVLMIELNEINFEHVRGYIAMGKLPQFAGLLAKHTLVETTSEENYEDLEPWIQWVTAHTGLSLAEHGVFRLGDIVRHDLPQIWEALEAEGLKVGAISPMNAKNRCKNAAFFVPDPWTPTPITGSALMKGLYAAVAQAVNDNASSRLTLGSAAWLLAGLAAYARPQNYGTYVAIVAAAIRGRSWAKALLLDQLLADIFLREVRRKRPDFASLFLNAGAHIQHHYMFNAAVYSGPRSNPSWYVDRDADPVLEVYQLYDRIIGQLRQAFPKARLMLATGLHQDPHLDLTFYWRIKDHIAFLTMMGVPFERVEPRMSRDFVIFCLDAKQALAAEHRLSQIQSMDGTPLFKVDNRGESLFVVLSWPHDIPEGFACRVGNRSWTELRKQVAFVAVKNGGHNGIGYFVDTGAEDAEHTSVVSLASLPRRVASACGVRWVDAV